MKTSTDKSGGSSADREKILEQELEIRRRKIEAEWAIADELQLPDYLSVVYCHHVPKDGREPHWTVMLRKDHNNGRDLDFRALLEVIDQFGDRIRSVDRWQHVSSDGSPVTMATWSPEPCNCSAPAWVHHAEKVGEAKIELSANGTAKFHARKVSFWIKSESTGVWLEFDVEVNRFPQKWESRPRFKGFSSIDGECTGMEFDGPPGLNGTARTGLGSRDSWRFETWWDDVDEFRKALLRQPVG